MAAGYGAKCLVGHGGAPLRTGREGQNPIHSSSSNSFPPPLPLLRTLAAAVFFSRSSSIPATSSAASYRPVLTSPSSVLLTHGAEHEPSSSASGVDFFFAAAASAPANHGLLLYGDPNSELDPNSVHMEKELERRSGGPPPPSSSRPSPARPRLGDRAAPPLSTCSRGVEHERRCTDRKGGRSLVHDLR